MLKVRVLTGYRQLFGDLMPLEEFVKEYRKIYQLGQDLFLKYDPCQINKAGCT